MAAHEPTQTNKGERTGPARFYSRRIGLDCVDRWDDEKDIRFLFGYEAHDSLKPRADELPAHSYRLPFVQATSSRSFSFLSS
jgi:hypothetical protein